MNDSIKKVYAVYWGDDRGYPRGDPLSIYPFEAAAINSEEYKKQNGYGLIVQESLLSFGDDNFLLEKTIDKKNIIGALKIGVPTKGYRDFIYNEGFEKTKYFVGEKEIINYLDKDEIRNTNLSKIWLFSSDESCYVLKSDKTFKIASFIMSRDMAVLNALNKLTKEEKGLLGLI